MHATAALVLCLLVAAASAVQHQQQASSDFAQSVPVSSIEGAQYPGAVFQDHGVHAPSVVGGQVQPNLYSPAAGIIQVVGDSPKVGSVQQQGAPGVARYAAVGGEQYGQPEAQTLPPNYKPFGSWGLYIGGNPADGYYSNYYKSLGDKQQVGSVSGVEQASGIVKPAVASSGYQAPIQRQAFVGGVQPQPGSFVGSEYYPIAYSPAELNSIPAPAGQGFVSPVHAGAQIYGTPASFDSSLAYASPESYASAKGAAGSKAAAAGQSKGVAALAQQTFKEVQQQQQQAPGKGVVSRYAYAMVPQPQQYHHTPQHTLQQQIEQHQQVVAYPVPVGSQIVGSQAGVDGAFQPYGVHAFTKYAVKPAVMPVVASGPSSGIVDSGVPQHQQQHSHYYYQYPSYKVQGANAFHHQSPVGGYQPFSFYGYPVGQQLHYNSAGNAPMYGPSSYAVGHDHHQSGSLVSAPAVPVTAGSGSSSSVSSSVSSVSSAVPVVHSSSSGVVDSPVVVSDKHVVEGVQKDKPVVDAQAQ